MNARIEPLTNMSQVPQLDFTTFNYVAALPFAAPDLPPRRPWLIDMAAENSTGRAWWQYNDPSQPVQYVALVTAGLGRILSTSKSQGNATWDLDFAGPALQCHNILGPERAKVHSNIWEGQLWSDFGPGAMNTGKKCIHGLGAMG